MMLNNAYLKWSRDAVIDANESNREIPEKYPEAPTTPSPLMLTYSSGHGVGGEAPGMGQQAPSRHV